MYIYRYYIYVYIYGKKKKFSRPESGLRFFFLCDFFLLQIWTPRSLKRRHPSRIFFDFFLGVRHRQNMHTFRKRNRDRFWMLRIPKRQESKEKLIPTHIVIEKSASKEKKPVVVARICFLPYIYIYYIYIYLLFWTMLYSNESFVVLLTSSPPSLL
jgi:hypothetical protein